jgi:hypothetical protein
MPSRKTIQYIKIIFYFLTFQLGWCELALEKLVPNKSYHVWLKLQDPEQGQIRVRVEVDHGTTLAKAPTPAPAQTPATSGSFTKPTPSPVKVVTTPVTATVTPTRVVSTPVTAPIAHQGNTPAVKNVSSTFVDQIIRQCQQSNSKYEGKNFPRNFTDL